MGAVAETLSASGRISMFLNTESVRQPLADTPFSDTLPVVAVPGQVTLMVAVFWPLLMVPPTTRQRYVGEAGPVAV